MVRPRAPIDPDDERLRKDRALPLFDSVEPASRTGVDSSPSAAGVGSTPASPRSTERDDSTVFPHESTARTDGEPSPDVNAHGCAKRASGGGASTGAPTPTVCVEQLEPTEPDGQDWKADAIAEAIHLVRVHGYVTPSMLRAARPEPPHPNHWGSVWARLKTLGLERTTEEVVSTIRTRNAAREAVWKPGEKWGRA